MISPLSEAAAANPTLAAAIAAVPAVGAAIPGAGGEGGGGSTFPADVEAEANSYFQRLYSGQHTVEQTVDMLTRFRGSQNTRERDIFGCMVHNLFDEYRFFPKYPEKELRITAVLFGRLINHQLVVSMTLGVALRCVLDALRTGMPESAALSGAAADGVVAASRNDGHGDCAPSDAA